MLNARTLFLFRPSTSQARELRGLNAHQIWLELVKPENQDSALGVLLPEQEKLPSEVSTASANCQYADGRQEVKTILIIEPAHVGEIETVISGSGIEVMALAAPTG